MSILNISKETSFGSGGWNEMGVVGIGEASILGNERRRGSKEREYEKSSEIMEYETGQDLYNKIAGKVEHRKERINQRFGGIKERFSRLWNKIKVVGEVAFLAPDVITGAGLQVAGKGLAKGAEAVGSGVVTGAEAIGRGAKATGKGIVRGGEMAVRGVVVGGETVAGTAMTLGKGGADLMKAMGEKGIRTTGQAVEFLQQSAQDIYQRTEENVVNIQNWGSEQAENIKNGIKTTAKSVERGVIGWLEWTKQRRGARKTEKAANKKARLESKFLEREDDLIAKINSLQSQLDALKLESNTIAV